MKFMKSNWLPTFQQRLHAAIRRGRRRNRFSAGFQRRTGRLPTLPLVFSYEPLEQRAMLAADLSYATAGGLTDLTLTFDTNSSQFHLVDTNDTDTIVSSASKADATDGGIRITGTTNDDRLRLDVAKLSSAGPTATITFVGGLDTTATNADTDTVIVQQDADFSLAGSTLSVGATSFAFAGVERLDLIGGVSANAFTFGDVTIPAVTVDGGNNSNTILSTVADNAWNIGLGETLADAGTLGEVIAFTSVENIVGGTGIDVFTFADNASITGTLDGGLGSNALDYSAYESPTTVNLAAQTATGTGGVRSVTGVVGGAGSDTLIGSAIDAVWQISGADSGLIEDVVEFSGIENITGSDAGSDFFIIEGEGSISGTLSGGAGGVDGIIVYADDGSYSRLNPKSAAGSHAATVHGKAITYAGLESVLDGNLTSLVIHGSPLRDMWTLADDLAVAGQIVLTSNAGKFFDDAAVTPGLVAELKATRPATGSIRVNLGADSDVLLVQSVATATVSLTVDGGGGKDELQARDGDSHSWDVAAAYTGTLDAGAATSAASFESIESLVGGDEADTFTFAGNAAVEETINGVATDVRVAVDGGSGGFDTVDYSNVSVAVTVSFADAVATIDSVIGGSGADTLIGFGDDNVWTLNGQDKGTLVTTSRVTAMLNSTVVVDSTANTLRFVAEHNLVSGQVMVYTTNLSTADTSGLVSGTTYYIEVVDAKVIRLYSEEARLNVVGLGANPWAAGSVSSLDDNETYGNILFESFENLFGGDSREIGRASCRERV